MAHEPKLEIYTITLSRKEKDKLPNFRYLFYAKFEDDYSKLSKPFSSKDVLSVYFQDFVKKIDTKGFTKNEKKKKGFHLAPSNIDGHITNISEAKEAFSGILVGGNYDRILSLGNIDDAAKSSEITQDLIVGSLQYFLLYTPLNHNVGLLIMQGYSEGKISDIFKEYIEKYFKAADFKSECNFYFPESLKSKYTTGATFDSVKFTTDFQVEATFENSLPSDYHFQVKIEIIDKNLEKTPVNKSQRLMNFFNKGKFNIGSKDALLEEFETKKRNIKHDNKSFSVDFDNVEEIRPTINLKDHNIPINAGNIPNFKELDNWCRLLLDEIKSKILPSDATTEL